jgi:hypothetical protein
MKRLLGVLAIFAVLVAMYYAMKFLLNLPGRWSILGAAVALLGSLPMLRRRSD